MKSLSFFAFAFFAFFAISNFAFAANDAFVNASLVTSAIQANGVAANSTVNGNASYSVLFNTSAVAYNRTAFNITFPAGFIMTNAIPANRSGSTGFLYFNGTYNGSLGYTFRITGQIFEMFLIINGSQPAANWSNTNFNVTIANIQNTNVSGTYQTTARAFDSVQNNMTTEGPNVSSAFTLNTYPAFNISIAYGNSQTGTINESLATNITALVTDDFGNAIQSYPVNFTALNFTLYDGRIGLNNTHATMYQSLNATTNSTGHAGIFAFIGNTTLNASTTRYGFNATGFNLTTNATSYQTPQAARINYYILTASSTAPVTDSAFTILVSSYDIFHNINGTGAWNGTINVTPFGLTGLTYSTDGSSYLAWPAAGVNRDLANGNVTTWFKQSTNADLTFNFNDTGDIQATGTSAQVQIRSPGVSGIGGGVNPTPTPSPTPAAATPKPSPSPTPRAPVLERNVDSSTKVTGTFGSDSTSFVLTYTAATTGFYGDLVWTLPFDFADYQSEKITFNPTPKRVVQGSVVATWENVDLKAGGKFTASITVGKSMDSSVMQQFAKPSLNAKTRPSPTIAPTPTPTPAPTLEPILVAQRPDYTLWFILIVLIAAGGYYYFFMRKKRGLYGK